MSDSNQRSHEDKAHRDDKRDERLNPGQNAEGEGSVGAPGEGEHGGAAAKQHPLDEADAEQAGTERNPKFKTEDQA
jgi:hypothetical protein